MSDELDPAGDPLIDSLLEEVLGGQEPPDLSQRILDAHRASKETQIHVSPSISSARSRRRQAGRHTQARRMRRFTGWGVALVVLIGAGLFAAWAWQEQANFRRRNMPPVAERVSTPDVPANNGAITISEPRDKLEGQEESTIKPGWIQPDVLLEKMRGPQVASDSEANTAGPKLPLVESPRFERRDALDSVVSDSQVVRLVNERLAAGWRRAKVTPTDGITDDVWLARATLALVGREPTPAELASFAERRDREAVVEQLMSHEDFAKHWAKRFTDILVGSATSRGFSRSSLESYLADSFETNKSFDQLAFELITAQGGSEEGAGGNPAVNFALAYQEDGRAQSAMTEKLCQVFLGTQMQCARCHDHPFNRKLQQQIYWETAAFLTQVRRESTSDGRLLLVDRDDAGADGRSVEEAALFYNRPDKTLSAAYAKFPGSKKEPIESGVVDEVNRRVELAYSIVGSERFAIAVVNRLWREVFGQGFTQPVDNIGPRDAMSHPELLTSLARQFRNSKYDMRSALQWMVRSTAFNRKSRLRDDPMRGRMGLHAFSSFPRQRLISHPTIQKPLSTIAAKATQRNPADVLGNQGATRKVSPEVAALERQKVNAIHRERLLSAKPGTLIGRLAGNHSLSDRQVVAHLFYAFVGRPPTEVERASGEAILASRPRGQGLVEIGQIVLNSREFNTQH